MNDRLLPSYRPFDRRGHGGYVRKTPLSGDHTYRNQSERLQPTDDTLFKPRLSAELKSQVMAEAKRRNISISQLIREIFSAYLQVDERQRRLCNNDPLAYPTSELPTTGPLVRLWVLMSPRLKRLIIEEARRQQCSQGQLTRRVVRAYFFEKLKNGQQ